MDEAEPKRKKRKLPPVAFSSDKADDAAQHQGRTRSTPHVPGSWPSHIYVDLRPSTSSLQDLGEVVGAIVASNSAADKPWYSLIDGEPKSLHLSLSRPFSLRTAQRDAFRVDLTKALRTPSRAKVSFATLCPLVNDDRTRAFVALEVGAGHSDLRKLTDRIDSVLDESRLPAYYPGSTRFHASIAWRLHERDKSAADDWKPGEPPPDGSVLSADALDKLDSSDAMKRLRQIRWDVDGVTLRIGKTDHVIPLSS